MKLMRKSKQHSKEFLDVDLGMPTHGSRFGFHPLPATLYTCAVGAEPNDVWPLRKLVLSGSHSHVQATNLATYLVLENQHILLLRLQRPISIEHATPFTTRHPRGGGVMQDKETKNLLDCRCSHVLKPLPMRLHAYIQNMYRFSVHFAHFSHDHSRQKTQIIENVQSERRRQKAPMEKKQLNVWIEGTLKEALAERAKREQASVTDLTENILRQDMARQSGESIERQALPLIQEIVAVEVHKARAHLLGELRNEIHLHLMDEIKTVMRLSDDRLAKLVVRVVRDAGIGRRLAMAQLSKAYGPDFARSAYESARDDVSKELTEKASSKAPSQEGGRQQERKE